MDALQSSIEALQARLRRCTQSAKSSVGNQQRQAAQKNLVPDTQISQLKFAIERLSLVNSENLKKVKFVESALKQQESSKC